MAVAIYQAEAVPPPEPGPVHNIPVHFTQVNCMWKLQYYTLQRTFNVHGWRRRRPRAYVNRRVGLGPNERLNLRFNAYPHGIVAASQDFLSLAVFCNSNSESRFKINSRIGVLNRNGEQVHVFNTECEIKGRGVLRCANFLPRNLVRPPVQPQTNLLLTRQQLRIFFEMKITRIIPIPAPIQGFGQFLESGRHTDLVLVVNGVELPAHKVILCQSSPVFAAMFEHDTIESRTGKVTIADVNVQTMRSFLQYIYTGRVDNLQQVARALMPPADYYGVEGLKSMCEHALSREISVDTAPSLLSYADHYSALKLKAVLLDFITANSRQVLNKAEYREMAVARPELALEVTMRIVDDSYAPSCAKKARFVGPQ